MHFKISDITMKQNESSRKLPRIPLTLPSELMPLDDGFTSLVWGPSASSEKSCDTGNESIISILDAVLELVTQTPDKKGDTLSIKVAAPEQL